MLSTCKLDYNGFHVLLFRSLTTLQNHYYMGLRQVSGNWVWSDGSDLDIDILDLLFAVDDPPTADCVTLTNTRHQRMDTVSCGDASYYTICQTDAAG